MILGFEAKRVFQNYSGLGNYSRNTINLLAKYFPENRYKLFAPKLTNLYQLPDSAEVIVPKPFVSRFLGSFWRLYLTSKLLKYYKIDVFHGFSHVLPYGIEKTGIPSVVTIHDLIFLRYPDYYKKIDRKMYEVISRSACRRSTRIIAISNQTKSDLVQFFGIDTAKIDVIYQSCNPLFYQRVSQEQKSIARLKFNLPEIFILCVGTIEKRKNQLAILKAIVHEQLDINVVILGKSTEYIQEMNSFILESGIQTRVTFQHNTSLEELQAIYQMAEIMIYPSFFEGFGLPVLEAQASGCPVITSNISSLPEAGGDGALYINPENIPEIGAAIKSLLFDKHLKDQLIQKGTANAALFSEKLVAQKLMKLYAKLLARNDEYKVVRFEPKASVSVLEEAIGRKY